MKDIRQNWKDLANAKAIRKEDILALCLYKTLFKEQGKEEAIVRIKKSFIPIENEIKLANGAEPYAALSSAMYSLRGSNVYFWLEDADKEKLLTLAKEIKIRGKDIQ